MKQCRKIFSGTSSAPPSYGNFTTANIIYTGVNFHPLYNLISDKLHVTII